MDRATESTDERDGETVEESVEDYTERAEAASGNSVRPLVRHGTDLLDLLAEGVPFAVAHGARASASAPRPLPTSED